MKTYGIFFQITFFLVVSVSLIAQNSKTDANIFGDVQSNGEHVPFASIFIEGTTIGTTTDETGHYMLINLPEGEHIITAKAIGYKPQSKNIVLEHDKSLEVNFQLEEEVLTLNQVVVTGTKTFKRQTESPVIVNVLDRKTLNSVQACNISEGLRFQPGLRVETDCQTCNYTQLRMNGLGGGYSQILINGRPVFSPLTSLYGMEQIPANMVDRIEVVRGGGSSLYGSSAVGGTVNIITRFPNENNFDVNYTLNQIDNQSIDQILAGNLTVVNKKRNAGASVYFNRRDREAYDNNGDNFSELPKLRNNSFGANLYFKPTQDQKIEFSLASLEEYRFGGEMVNKPAYLTQQSEERTHAILMGSLDYQINFNHDKQSLIFYLAGQQTKRDHYTGVFPDDQDEIQAHLENPPYGNTLNTSFQVGTQYNHLIENFPLGQNVFTFGAEYLEDKVSDTIKAYQFFINQTTKNLGVFAQSDWLLGEGFNLLAGLRADEHNLVSQIIVSPRISLLYKTSNGFQFRGGWATGFRAPQAFDSDMHIAFAGGGVSRVELDPNLKEEKSNSFSLSANYDKATENYVAGFTLEAFYTKLGNAFYLEPTGSDAFGDVFIKRNGPSAFVQGITLEGRANYNRIIQLEAGYTLQKSEFDQAVETLENLEPKKEFLRTPDHYGYWVISYFPNEKFNASLNGVYTGKMLIAHAGGAPEQLVNAYKSTEAFNEINFKIGYTIKFENISTGLEIFGGVKNITNAYQSDFDTTKNRDSNYIYGPGLPRTIFTGIRLSSL